jgi:hypothetical protein
MALPGISNANEFYSAHYLESVLAGDIKKVRKRWSEAAKAQLEADLAAGLSNATVSTPEARFKALRKPWQKLREAESGITDEPAERLRLQRELFFQPLLEALGYPFAPHAEPVLIGGEAYQVPLLGEVNNAKGEPWLWVVECFNPSDEPADPLELTITTLWGCQIDDPSLGTVLTDGDGQGSETWEELISERVFGQAIPPRWVLAVCRDLLLLIDRQKWAASRLLRFELGTLLGENNPDALLAAATLLHREHTCPTGGGTPLLDELDENSHKHAYEVSSDLKYALRRSIELLGNEVVAFIKAALHVPAAVPVLHREPPEGAGLRADGQRRVPPRLQPGEPARSRHRRAGQRGRPREHLHQRIAGSAVPDDLGGLPEARRPGVRAGRSHGGQAGVRHLPDRAAAFAPV